MSLIVKDWRKFQHYKHRDPPWIRLYRNLLNDREWFNLDGDAAKMLIMCWLIASENEGKLPSSADLAFRFRMTEEQVNLALSKLDHWVQQDASIVLADCKQDATTETETETEEDTASAVSPSKGYAFESGVIRLTEKDLTNWQTSFSNLDVRAELIGLTEWANTLGRDRWFHGVSAALAKRNREIQTAFKKPRVVPFDWKEAIV